MPSGPWRIIRRAALWLIVAEAAAFMLAVLIVAVATFIEHRAHPDGAAGWRPSPFVYALPATVALQATLLFADFRQGRYFGAGDVAAGLGAGPVRRRGLIALLGALVVAWVLAYIFILVQFKSVANFIAKDVTPTPVLLMTGGPLLIIVRTVLIAVLAPLAEELFFRGWMWTALRRFWGVWSTALCTGGVWLALHALEGAVRVPILVPTAILLSLARHYGESVRASIPIHIANNMTAVAVQLVATMAPR